MNNQDKFGNLRKTENLIYEKVGLQKRTRIRNQKNKKIRTSNNNKKL